MEWMTFLQCIDLARNFKSNLSLYSVYCAEACSEFVESIYASLCPGNTGFFKEMLQRWRVVGNTLFDLIGSRCEP